MAKFQTKCFTNAKPLVLPDAADPEWTEVDIEFNPTAYAVNDLIQVASIPEGYRVLDYVLAFPDIDTGVTPTLAWSFGVSNATVDVPVSTDIGAGTRVFGTALAAGRDGAIVRNISTNCSQDAFRGTATQPGVRDLVLKVTTAAATYAGANKVGKLLLLLAQ